MGSLRREGRLRDGDGGLGRPGGGGGVGACRWEAGSSLEAARERGRRRVSNLLSRTASQTSPKQNNCETTGREEGGGGLTT